VQIAGGANKRMVFLVHSKVKLCFRLSTSTHLPIRTFHWPFFLFIASRFYQFGCQKDNNTDNYRFNSILVIGIDENRNKVILTELNFDLFL